MTEGKCFKCGSTLVPGERCEPRNIEPRLVRVPGTAPRGKAGGDGSSIRLVAWICPRCCRTRTVGPA